MFSISGGMRVSANKLMIFISDGDETELSIYRSRTDAAVAKLRDNGRTVFQRTLGLVEESCILKLSLT